VHVEGERTGGGLVAHFGRRQLECDWPGEVVPGRNRVVFVGSEAPWHDRDAAVA
jgi:hypothetical protein